MTFRVVGRTLSRMALVGGLTVSLSAWARSDESRYGTWQPQATATQSQQKTTGDSTAALVAELEALIDEAERARAADPLFLKDLKDLVRDYSWPWSVSLMADSFNDGNHTNNPRWTIVNGAFRVERNGGMRSIVKATRRTKPSDRQAAEAILGAILNTGNNNGSQEPPYRPGQPATAYVPIDRLPNAFAIEASLQILPLSGEGMDNADPPRLEIGVYQGQSLATGYRVIYEPMSTPGLLLTRGSSRGSSVIDVANAGGGQYGRPHTVAVTRNKEGEMTVSLDGMAMIQTFDRAFRDMFSGVVIENKSGDFEVKLIEVSAMP